MDDFLEFDIEKKSIKSINLDDFSVEDLREYIKDLEKEKKRVDLEIKKKNNFQEEAKKFFKSGNLTFRVINVCLSTSPSRMRFWIDFKF